MCTRAIWTVICGLASLMIAEETRPVITGVVNAATVAAGPVAPGSLVMVTGVHLSGAVQFEGIEASVLEAHDDRLVVLVPAELTGRAAAGARVGGSESFEVKLSVAAPGIFSADGSGQGRAAIAEPGRKGTALSFEATGLAAGDPLVWIAGRRASVIAVGEGSVRGCWKITVLVPVELEVGGLLPLMLESAGARSQIEVLVEVEGPVAPKPAVPGRVTALGGASGGVRLAWTPGDEQPARFRIERRIQAQVLEVAVVGSVTTWSDAEATLGQQPQYRLRAETDYGWSVPTPWVAASAEPGPAVSAAPPPAPPAGLRVLDSTARSVRLSWTAGTPAGQRFRVERRAGSGGYGAVASTEAALTNNWQDSAVQPATSYGYRVRAESADGTVVSTWSAEAAVATPPSAPPLEGVLLSGNAVRLSWPAAEAGTQRFRLESRAGDAPFTEVARYGASQTSVRLDSLNAGTGYTFRLRAESEAGTSAWSNEVFLLTTTVAPPAPTNLRGVPVSTTEIELTWSNSAPEATAIRVEMRQSPGMAFTERATAADLTRTRITGLAPATGYAFRVRTEAPTGLSVYSNEITVTTLASTQPRSVFLIHGLGQDPSDLVRLRSSLAGPLGVDPARFSVDSSFSWAECAARSCPSNCSLGETAERLAAYILSKPPGDVVLVGVGAGGLVARDLIAYNRGGVLTQRRMAGLVTLGTPSLGYPYAAGDEALGCPQLLRDLRGDFRRLQQNGRTELSSYLETLFGVWAQRQFPGGGSKWLAVSGRSCAEAARGAGQATGCRDHAPASDGAVCDESAVYSVATRAGATPGQTWRDPQGQYSRADGLVSGLCPANAAGTLPLNDPPVGSALFEEIRRFINGL